VGKSADVLKGQIKRGKRGGERRGRSIAADESQKNPVWAKEGDKRTKVQEDYPSAGENLVLDASKTIGEEEKGGQDGSLLWEKVSQSGGGD